MGYSASALRGTGSYQSKFHWHTSGDPPSHRRGGRLTAETPPTPDDLQKLARFQADYQPSLEEVVAVLRDRLHITSSGLFDGVALTTTSRPGKTIETLREKLRKGIPLRVIQDITGLRVVGDLRLSQQNDLRDQIKKCFAGSRVDEDDRRVTPSSGYRAVHLIPVVLGLPVEIQLRTASQDAWAQASEKLGDLWGRWHRYGLPPEGPTPEERERRGQFIEQYRLIGDAFYSHELVLDRKTLAFYLTLLGLLVLDLVLILWILNPFSNFATSAYASQKGPVVSDTAKPSPFEIADAKRLAVQAVRRKPKLSNVSN